MSIFILFLLKIETLSWLWDHADVRVEQRSFILQLRQWYASMKNIGMFIIGLVVN